MEEKYMANEMKLEINEQERNLLVNLLSTINLTNSNEVVKLALNLKDKLLGQEYV
jgi:hypothetical protein